jgi:hypothetical protein
MRSLPRHQGSGTQTGSQPGSYTGPYLGPVNLALIALYFIPTWGKDALKVLLSPYSGFEDRAQAAVAIYFRQLFDLGLDGTMRVSNVLAGIKLVIAAGFVAYLIEFARSLVVGRDVDRKTVDAVLGLAVVAMLVWALPALGMDDPSVVRIYATQMMLVAGAVVVITVERQTEHAGDLDAHPGVNAAALFPPPVVPEWSAEAALGGRAMLMAEQRLGHPNEHAPSL